MLLMVAARGRAGAAARRCALAARRRRRRRCSSPRSIALDVPALRRSARLVGPRRAAGFLDFYDVLVPFDAVGAPADARRRPARDLRLHRARPRSRSPRGGRSLASLVARRRARAGRRRSCPAHDDLGRGALVLAGGARARRLAAARRPARAAAGPRRARRSSSSRSSPRARRARREGRSSSTGRTGTSTTSPASRSSVDYVWDANYGGIDFPKKRTRVLTVKAPARAPSTGARRRSTCSTDDRWVEEPSRSTLGVGRTRSTAAATRCCRPRARDPTQLGRAATCTIDALRDTHLVGPSAAGRSTTRGRSAASSTSAAASRVVSGGCRAEPSTRVWSYAPQPTPGELAQVAGRATRRDRSTARTSSVGRAAARPAVRHARSAPTGLATYFDDDARRPRAYQPLYRARSGRRGRRHESRTRRPSRSRPGSARAGGFVYDEQPPRRARACRRSSQFVTRTKRGYCQHFAGAMALMLRYLGIPARVAAGFTSGALRRGRGTWTVDRPRRARLGRGLVPGLRLAPVRPDAGPRDARRAVLDLLDAVRRRRCARRARRRRRSAGEPARSRGSAASDERGSAPNTPGGESRARAARNARDEGVRACVGLRRRSASLAAALLVVAGRSSSGAAPLPDAGSARDSPAPAGASSSTSSRPGDRRAAERDAARARRARRTRLGVDADRLRRRAGGAPASGRPTGRVEAARAGAARAARGPARPPRRAIAAEPPSAALLALRSLAAELTWTRSSWPRARGAACARSPSAGRSRCCRSTGGR